MSKKVVHLLDVGSEAYGDCVLCEFGEHTVLIDGGHPSDFEGSDAHDSIPEQLRDILGLGAMDKVHVSLLIVSHAHNDHIGCLPKMVAAGALSADWVLATDPRIAWGRAEQDFVAVGATDNAQLLAAALREEVHEEVEGEDDFREFLTDAATLEVRYTQMLKSLEDAGSHVVRYPSSEQDVEQLLQAFGDIGLLLLGPSEQQVLQCAEIIGNRGRDALDRSRALEASSEMTLSELRAAYREVTGLARDAVDAGSTPSPAINCQSFVVSFNVDSRRFLFTGDMQFESPQLGDPELAKVVKGLLTPIREGGPYDFVKIAHHGSKNAFGQPFFDSLGGTELFGICAGELSTHHPSPESLALLNKHRDQIRWVRTDKNGRCSLDFGSASPTIQKDRGRIKDASSNTDVAETSSVSTHQQGVTTTRTAIEASRTEMSYENLAQGAMAREVPVKLHGLEVGLYPGVRLNLSIEIASSPEAGGRSPNAHVAGTRTGAGDFQLGGGRTLPKLAFVTDWERLSGNIGQAEASAVRRELMRNPDHLVIDVRSTGRTASAVAMDVRGRLQGAIEGVVVVGGYDVVPAQILDSLPPRLRSDLGAMEDPDDFRVWSDAVYGDLDGDGMQELPVSRVPDGLSGDLVAAALSSTPVPPTDQTGLRNRARPFADDVYRLISQRKMHQSEPFPGQAPCEFNGEHIYLMLHGDFQDGTRFWGEQAGGAVEALHLAQLNPCPGAIVFTGCCWGALVVKQPAGRLHPAETITTRAAGDSLAMTFLQQGASAFVGCTGAHYSPLREPYGYYGGPMHTGFWSQILRGQGPAKALYLARLDYLRGLPHISGMVNEAIEYKIFSQYTCLGLGW